jgi:hypothetical protein
LYELSRPRETCGWRHGACGNSGLNTLPGGEGRAVGVGRMAHGARRRLGCLLILLAAALGACAGQEHRQATDVEINVPPANYRSDILGAMHAYLNDPTKIRDAAVSEPTLKPINTPGSAATLGLVGKTNRYVACVRFNAKKSSGEYAGVKENVAVFFAGRLDQFLPAPRDMCKDAAYQPFPELEKLSR